MTLRHRIHDWSRRRKFAALLRSYGFRPTREQLDLAIRYDLDQPRKRP